MSGAVQNITKKHKKQKNTDNIIICIFKKDMCVDIMHIFSCIGTESGRNKKKSPNSEVSMLGGSVFFTFFHEHVLLL